MPRKLSLFVVESERRALPDGRVAENVSIELASKASYPWQCVCPAGQHDHKPFIARIMAGLANREEVIEPIAALVGQKIEVGGTVATITDANIQMHGPAKWPLLLQWQYADGRYDSQVIDAEDPLTHPAPEELLGRVTQAVVMAEAASVAARDAEEFKGEPSDPDPEKP